MDFDAFVVAQQGSLLRTALALAGGDLHRAEDLVQTALTRCWLRWGRISRLEYPKAYCERVLYSVFISQGRRRRAPESPLAAAAQHAAPNGGASFDTDLLRAVQALPPRQRAVIVARYLTDLTETETAQRLGCSVGTLKSQTWKALQALKASPALADGTRGRPASPPERRPTL